jgi:DEAD/DEAH box helicase domain-containing protein
MRKNIVVFDIETKNSFSDVGGRDLAEKLDISIVGTYDYGTDEFKVYEESEFAELVERLSRKPLLVGFNSKKFDTPILQKYIPFDLKKLPQLDIMEEITKVLGHRVGLDSFAKATLGEGKSGSGLEAIKLWREGKIDELKSYCQGDVRITRDIYEYGASHSELLYMPKFGSGKARVGVSWRVEHPEEGTDSAAQHTLF